MRENGKDISGRKEHCSRCGYFCCTIGNASQETIRQYIESQGELRQFIPEAEDIGVFLTPLYKISCEKG